MYKNLDLIIYEVEDADFIFYKKNYSSLFNVISLKDKKLNHLVSVSSGLLYLRAGEYLDLVNFASRDLSESLKIYRLSNDNQSHSIDRIYPDDCHKDCADFAVYSGCFYVNKDDCQKSSPNFLDMEKTISRQHIEAFNFKPFKPNEYKSALFLDRDGILNVDTGYTFEVSKLEIVPGVLDFLKRACLKYTYLLVVTNQAGVSKGLYGEAEVLKFNHNLKEFYSENGVELSAFEYCPFHINGVDTKYKKHSFKRKPHVGMVFSHLYQLPINLKDSVMIGDRESDILNETLLKFYILESRYLHDNSSFRVYKNFLEIEKSLFLS